jgi:hypothetical protein
LALAELVVFLGHIEALGGRDPSRLGFDSRPQLAFRRYGCRIGWGTRYSDIPLSTALAVAWALPDAASVRADDCSGGKEAAIERARTPQSDTHVTNVAGKVIEAGRATDERR